MAARFVSAAIVAFVIPSVSASKFLMAKQAELEEATRENIKSTLMSELSVDSIRLKRFEDELRPMFAALPKNEHGKLESPAVRYSLHRYFVRTHGWYVVGLEPLGQAWNSTSPSNAVKGKVPAYIQSLFDERLQGKGLGLHELAVFAATMLDFVHNEVIADVMDLYKALNLQSTAPITPADADLVVRGYILQILDGNTTADSAAHVQRMENDMREWFPSYEDFLMWVQDVRRTRSEDRRGNKFIANDLTIDSIAGDVREVNDQLFAFQDIECRTLKAGLMELEHGNTGRVHLSDYYAAGLRGDFLFVEHLEYLKRLGAIDETDPNHPSVIISNFLTSKANCLTETSFHSVCCLDECQALWGHLESSIAAPMATPGKIIELVSAMPSDTVDAPRNLSASLISRLGEIADHHDGHVPLHGRLFAQWMHHAYPLECAYPHAADTTNPITQDEWMALTGAEDVTATEEDRLRFSNMKKPTEANAELPWMQLEELVGHHKLHKHPRVVSSGRKVAAFAAVLAFAAAIAGAASRFVKSSSESMGKEKFMV